MSVLTAYYDLSVGPVSFDFCVFLVKAELARMRAGAKRLHVVIVPFERGVAGMFRDKTNLYDEHEMHWRLWNICIPACQLVGASVTLATDWQQAKRISSGKVWPADWDRQTLKDRRHLIGDIIAAAKQGFQIPIFRPSAHAKRRAREALSRFSRPVVTMTLRSTYLKERNSDRDVWMQAARYIEQKHYAVAFLEDTNSALARGHGYGELNIDLRMACYELAVLNLQANNGAASLCWFSDKPYRMFGAGIPADEWHGLFVQQGLALGDTWPWAKHGQKIVYGQTTADQMIAEFDSWMAEESALRVGATN